jgi:hypothetical protein
MVGKNFDGGTLMELNGEAQKGGATIGTLRL